MNFLFLIFNIFLTVANGYFLYDGIVNHTTIQIVLNGMATLFCLITSFALGFKVYG